MLRFKLFVKLNFLPRIDNICNHENGFDNFALIMALTFILLSTLDNLQNMQLEFIRLYFVSNEYLNELYLVANCSRFKRKIITSHVLYIACTLCKEEIDSNHKLVVLHALIL